MTNDPPAFRIHGIPLARADRMAAESRIGATPGYPARSRALAPREGPYFSPAVKRRGNTARAGSIVGRSLRLESARVPLMLHETAQSSSAPFPEIPGYRLESVLGRGST